MYYGEVISFEGISNSGKTSTIRAIADRLQSKDRKVIIKDDLLNYKGKHLGAKIKRILDAGAPTFRLGYPVAETLLICAKRAFESQSRLEPAVVGGSLLLLDRDVDTVCAYQLRVLAGYRSHVSTVDWVEWIRTTNRHAAVEPQLTIYLDVSAEESLVRELSRRRSTLSPEERAQYVEWNSEVRAAYHEVFEIPMKRRTLIRIDTEERPLEAVIEEANSEIVKWLRGRGLNL